MADTTLLVIDTDGAFLKTRIFPECFWSALGRAPMATLRALRRGVGRADTRAEIAAIAALDPARLPVRADLLELAQASRDAGRRHGRSVGTRAHGPMSPRILAA